MERDLQGESDRLKGFAIALDVFDREDNFDPSTDAVVRVQAGRLRDLLETYYSGEGADAPLRVTIPRGSYVPVYDFALKVPPLCEDIEPADGVVARNGIAGLDGTQIASPRNPASRGDYERMFYVNMRLFWSAVSVMVVLLCAIMAMLINNYRTKEPLAAANQGPTAAQDLRRFSASEALPSVSLVSDVDGRLRAVFEDAIPRFGSVVYRSDKAVTLDHPLADFYIQTVQTGERSLNVQFFHRESGILIGADQIPGGVNDPRLADQVSRILSRFLRVGGVIYAFLDSEGRLNPLTRCMSLTAAYFNEQTAERHLAAYRCHEDLMKEGVKSALTFADMAGLTVETLTDGYDYPTDASFATAVAMARRAVELSPNLAQAHRALGWALQASGEYPAALDHVRDAHALNRYDLSIAASYGNALIAVGDFGSAVDVLERATKAAPVHPSWWDYSLFMAAFQYGRGDLVSASARNLVGRNRSHYCAARLISAYLEGDEAMRTKMISEMSGHDDAFLHDPLEFYSKAMPLDAARRLVRVLGDAGLKSANTHDG